MRCERCGKGATVHVAQNMTGQVVRRHLCEGCARETEPKYAETHREGEDGLDERLEQSYWGIYMFETYLAAREEYRKRTGREAEPPDSRAMLRAAEHFAKTYERAADASEVSEIVRGIIG